MIILSVFQILEALHYWPDQEFSSSATVTWKIFNDQNSSNENESLVEFTAVPSLKPADVGPVSDMDDSNSISRIYTLDARRYTLQHANLNRSTRQKNLQSSSDYEPGNQQISKRSCVQVGPKEGQECSDGFKPRPPCRGQSINSIPFHSRNMNSYDKAEWQSRGFRFAFRNSMNDFKGFVKHVPPQYNSSSRRRVDFHVSGSINNLKDGGDNCRSNGIQSPNFRNDGYVSAQWINRYNASKWSHGALDSSRNNYDLVGMKRRKCYSFHNKGFCLYGPECQFVHDDQGVHWSCCR